MYVQNEKCMWNSSGFRTTVHPKCFRLPFMSCISALLKCCLSRQFTQCWHRAPALCELSQDDVGRETCSALRSPAKDGQRGESLEYDWFFTISCWQETRERRHVVAHGPRPESSAQQSRVPLWQQLRVRVCTRPNTNTRQHTKHFHRSTEHITHQRFMTVCEMMRACIFYMDVRMDVMLSDKIHQVVIYCDQNKCTL